MINVKKTKNKKYKDYDNLTLEDIINKYEIYHDSAIIHNGHVIGFSHEWGENYAKKFIFNMRKVWFR